MSSKQKEVDDNYKAFNEVLSGIISEHKGEYALMRHKEIISYYKSFYEAEQAGSKKFQDKMFSVQKVDINPVDLGYFSYA